MLKYMVALSLKHRLLFLLFIGGISLAVIVACGSIGVYDPQATQTALQGTVGSMQATIMALEAAGQADPTQTSAPPSPQVVVVTATPTDTPVSTPTPLSEPTSTPTDTPEPTATPLPAATTKPVVKPPAVTQSQVITIIVTATPILTTTIAQAYEIAPAMIAPEAGTIVGQGRDIVLQWSWNGVLGPGEYFDIKIRPDGQTRSAYIAWERPEAHTFKADLPPGRYYWSVQVLKGYYHNNSGEPEDRVFEAFLGPESEPRLIIIGDRPSSNPASQSQADPPAPMLPYGLVMGGLAFVAFATTASFTRRRRLP